jgi:hypothetical protein
MNVFSGHVSMFRPLVSVLSAYDKRMAYLRTRFCALTDLTAAHLTD